MLYNKYVALDRDLKDYVSYQVKDIVTDETLKNIGSSEDIEPFKDIWAGDKLADYSFIQNRIKNISGRILTIIDASIPEGKQNKCIKDLIRKEFIDEFVQLSEMLVDKSCAKSLEPEIVSAKKILEA